MANFWILCGLMEHYAAQLRQQADAGAAGLTPMPADSIADIGRRFPLAARVAPGRYCMSDDSKDIERHS